MFIEHFSEDSRATIIGAKDMAIRNQNTKVCPEHLLLAMLQPVTSNIKESDLIRDILKDLMVNTGILVTRLIDDITNMDYKDDINEDNIQFDEDLRRILNNSLIFANKSDSLVTLRHILYCIVSDKDIRLSRVFEEIGITCGDINNLEISNNRNKRETKFLDENSSDMTELARKGKLDPVFCRDSEIDRVIRILCRKTKNNPVLIGEPGVGKTAIVEGLAQRIISGYVPTKLQNSRLLYINLGSIVAGTKYRGMFEEKMKKILEDVKSDNNVILFIDEIHTIVGAGSAEGSLDASNILKPSLARGEIHCIGATTIKEYRKYIEKDGALERRFHPIMVEQPSIKDTIEIINGLKSRYEDFHGISIDDESIEQAVYLSDNYINDRFLPDKAIDVIDEASSMISARKRSFKIDMDKIKTLEENKRLRESVKCLTDEKLRVTVDDVEKVIHSWTGIPVGKMNTSESSRMDDMYNILSTHIIGQNHAIRYVTDIIKRSKVGLGNNNKPIGSFIFLGPSGVGKTELSKRLAEYLFGNRDSIIQLDMSEFSEKFSTSRLIGSPPGYVGYEDGGTLTESVRRHPHSIILLDELEKAHTNVLNIFLQILEEGHITDSNGRVISFKNTIIIMTSNIGQNIHTDKHLGFVKDCESLDATKDIIKKVLPTEFLNRLDKIITFHNLSKEDIYTIIDIKIGELNDKLKSKNINMSLDIDDDAKDWILEHGFSKEYGVRYLERCINENISNKISDGIIKGNFKDGDPLHVTCDSEGLTVLVLELSSI